MDCPECFLIIIPSAVLVIGIPLWAVGSKYTSNKVASLFTTLPFVPNGSFPYNSYYISQIENYSVPSRYANIKIPIRDKEVGNKEIYLLHNMWGFNIQAELFVDSRKVRQINTSQNINFSSAYKPLKRHPIYELPKIKSSLQNIELSQNIFYVYCPSVSNYTQFQSLEPFCQSSSGYPAHIIGNYSLNKLFTSIKDYSFDSITIKFHDSYAIPYNFIETPEAYIMFYRNSEKNAMRISGIVITSVGIFLSILFTIFILIIACC